MAVTEDTMMAELGGKEISRASALFDKFPYDRPWIEAALSRKKGRLYTGGNSDDPAAVLWPERGIASFVTGDPLAAGAGDTIAAYLSDFEAEPPPIWFLSVPTQAWKHEIIERFDDNFAPLPRVSFACPPVNLDHISGWEDDVPELCEVRRIDVELASRIPKEVDPDFALFWTSPEEFVEQSVGYCVLFAGELASIATSAFPLGRRTTIGVATAPEFEGRGYSTLACRPVLEHCLRGGIEPSFTTGADNIAARAVARKLGFADERHHWWLLHA
jgi:GNAT superfamily N-acetyltransferase